MEWQDEGCLGLADLDADEFNPDLAGTWTRGLLVRRNIGDGECACFTTWCPAGTSIETLVEVEGKRWCIEDAFETAKNELGLNHNETRSWHGWHRHVSLVMLAFAMLVTIRHRVNQASPFKKGQQAMPRLPRLRQALSAGPSRRSVASPLDPPKRASTPRTSSHGRFGDEPNRPPHNTHT